MRVIERAEIEAAVDFAEMASAIEAAYRAASAGEIELPPVGHLTFPDVAGDCHIKFGHRRGDPNFVVKIATGFPQLASIGDAVGNGLLLVLSAETGRVQAVLHDEMVLTDIRTAVGGAIATRALARQDATRLLVVGTGVQARRQIEAHAALLPQELGVQVWGRSHESAIRLVDELGPDIAAAAVTDLGAACGWAEIIVTATAAKAPIISADWISAGTHITAVGADAPGKRELDPRLLHRADAVVADSRAQCLDHGECSSFGEHDDATSAIVELGELLSGRPGRRGPEDITIADLTGVAAQDIAAAECVLDALGSHTD